MQDYFWVSSHDYFMGSTISPGHWGRVLSSYLIGVPQLVGRHAERLPKALREYIFETVRLSLKPKHPSRLEALFLCPDLTQACRLIRACQPHRNHEFVYRVELVDDRPVVPASMDLTRIDLGDTIHTLRQKAHLYWSGMETETMELLTRSPIRIREKVPLELAPNEPTKEAAAPPAPHLQASARA
ncbi:MAG: hypothetical protein AAF358_08645 [Pseudomonadota bacterium]